MKNLKNKLNKKGGFTLIEMLIVVAIIAILIAVSIPLVASALEKTRMATDAANERAAKAEAVVVYLEAGKIDGSTDDGLTANTAYFYDAMNGKLVPAAKFGDITPYGKCTTNSHDSNHVLAVAIDDVGEVHMMWVDAVADATLGTGKDYTAWDQDLCRDSVNG